MRLAFFFIFLVFLTGCSSEATEKGILAKCLTEKGAKMYGTEWCSFCNKQKQMFGSDFQHIDFVDCDKNKDECIEAGVKMYPTWVIDGEKYEGLQTMDKLSSLCK